MKNEVKESVSMEITRIATDLEKSGHKVYKLSIGDTHFDLPKILKHNLSESLTGTNTHYISSMGDENLRKSISTNEFSEIFKTNEILITPGVKQGLYYFFKIFKNKKVPMMNWDFFRRISL